VKYQKVETYKVSLLVNLGLLRATTGLSDAITSSQKPYNVVGNSTCEGDQEAKLWNR